MGLVSSCWSDDCQPASLHATPTIVSSVGLFKLHTGRTSHSQDVCTSMEFNRWVLGYSLTINTCTCDIGFVLGGCGLQSLMGVASSCWSNDCQPTTAIAIVKPVTLHLHKILVHRLKVSEFGTMACNSQRYNIMCQWPVRTCLYLELWLNPLYCVVWRTQ